MSTLYSHVLDIAQSICTCILFVYFLDYFVDIIISNLNVCFYFDKIQQYNKRNITLACCSVSLFQSCWLCRKVSHFGTRAIWFYTTNYSDTNSQTTCKHNILFKLTALLSLKQGLLLNTVYSSCPFKLSSLAIEVPENMTKVNENI